jgi:hypothetical protein
MSPVRPASPAEKGQSVEDVDDPDAGAGELGQLDGFVETALFDVGLPSNGTRMRLVHG